MQMFRVVQVLPLIIFVLIGYTPSFAQDKKLQKIKDWGIVVDPGGDCAVTESNGKLSIKVPGTLHDLFPGQ